MPTNHLFACVAVALVSVGCASEVEPEKERNAQAPASPTASPTTPSTETVVPDCPTASSDAGQPALTPSPIVACVGEYSSICTDMMNGSITSYASCGLHWLHRTSEGCTWGRDMVFHDDGTVTGHPIPGRWKGDAYYFQADFNDGTYFKFTRTTSEASK